MTAPRKARFVFTKLIVADEERMAAYYHAVYGLEAVARVAGESAAGGAFREVIMAPGTTMSESESLVMFRFLDRPAPRDQECITGFITDDLDALLARVQAHGGAPAGPVRTMPEHGIRVAFTTDPEGHLCENVQLVGG